MTKETKDMLSELTDNLQQDNVLSVERQYTNEEIKSRTMPIVYYPDARLSVPAVPVPSDAFGTDELQHQVECMFVTMKINLGVGIASPQIEYPFTTKKPNRIIIVQTIVNDVEIPVVMCNPVLITSEGTKRFEEGCLSIPSFFATVTRAATILVAYQDINGEAITLHATGISATIIQHEIEHLDGKLFVDDLSLLKKRRAKSKVKKHRKQNGLG